MILIPFLMGIAVIGSSILRQSSVSKGSYLGTSVSALIFSIGNLFSTKYISDHDWLWYGIYCTGGFAISIFMTYLNNKKTSRIKRASGMVILNKNGKILSIRKYKKKWSLPISNVLSGEDSSEAAIRIILEKTGFVASILEIPAFTSFEPEGENVTKVFFGTLNCNDVSFEGFVKWRDVEMEWVDPFELANNGEYSLFNSKLVSYMFDHIH
jgi:ADP-ribose pyrophosphatase YjhB (NUDIX family)